MEAKLLTEKYEFDENLECLYRYVYSDTEHFNLHCHEFYEFFLVLDGNVQHLINGKKTRLTKGSLVFIRPNDTHDYVSINSKPFSFLNISFTSNTAEQIFNFLGEGFNSIQLKNASMPPEIMLNSYELKRFNNRFDSIKAIDPKNIAELKTAMRSFLFNTFTRYFSSVETTHESMPIWLEQMCDKVKRDGNFALGSEYFFTLSDKSREHISRSLKKHTGMTVSEYINSLRLNFIANMLRNSNYNISQIIFDSGFNNISWASECFKLKYGMTMREYRNSDKIN